MRGSPSSTLFPYTTLFRSLRLPSGTIGPSLWSFNGTVMAPSSWNSVSAATASTTISVQRSEEHTSELQSHSDLVCRLLLEKKKQKCRPERVGGCQQAARIA